MQPEMHVGEEEERVQGFCGASELPLNRMEGPRGTGFGDVKVAELDVCPGRRVCWLLLGATLLGSERWWSWAAHQSQT